jgi:tetratricopeptide (TPR) repeat protein
VPSINAMAKKIQASAPKKGVWLRIWDFFKDAAKVSFVVATVAVVVVLIALGVGFWKKWKNPEPMIVVQPFEESTDAAKACGMTGKNAEDIFVDRLNELTAEAAAYHGNLYASKNSLGRLPEQPRIPVETAYGISVHGVSVDDVIRLFNRVRYDQWNITGDLFVEGKRCRVRVRLTRATGSSGWDSTPAKGQSVTDTVRLTTLKLIGAAHPELAGRALLQEIVDRKNAGVAPGPLYGQAEDAFRGWIVSRPQDLRAYAYLTTVYIYEGKSLEALYVTDWIQEWPGLKHKVEQAEAGRRSAKAGTASEAPPLLGEDTPEDRIAMMGATAKLTRRETTLDEMQSVKATFDQLAAKHPGDARYYLNSAVTSETIAVIIRNGAAGRSFTAAEQSEIMTRYEDAVQLLLRAVVLDPENAGVHRDIGQELSAFAGVQGRPNPPESIDELRLALHLLPSFRDAYNGSQTLLLASQETAKMDELCHTLQLLTLPVDGRPFYACEEKKKQRISHRGKSHS